MKKILFLPKKFGFITGGFLLLALFLAVPGGFLQAQGTAIVDSLTLVNAQNAADVLTVDPGEVILPSETGGRNYTFRANTAGTIGSVRFVLSGPLNTIFVANTKPYMLAGIDSSGYYNGLSFPDGTYTLTATPYTGPGATGSSGVSLSRTFTVGNSAPASTGGTQTTIDFSVNDLVELIQVTPLYDQPGGAFLYNGQSDLTAQIVNTSVVRNGVPWWNIQMWDGKIGWVPQTYLTLAAVNTDTTPPATPTLNTSVSGTTVNLNWNAVTDPSSVAYEVQKDGVNLITNLTTTSYVATNLSAGNHVFRIRAKDGSNNYSGWSSKTVTISAPGPVTTPTPTPTDPTPVPTDPTPTDSVPPVVTGHQAPGLIQAEDFSAASDATPGNSGLAFGGITNSANPNVDIEATTDTAGGHNVGWTNVGETLSYEITVAETGTYTVEYRLSSIFAQKNRFQVLLDGAIVHTVAVPSTGGWQSWATVSKTLNLTAGQHTLRLNIIESGWNINWIKFTKQTGTTAPDPTPLPTAPSTQFSVGDCVITTATSLNIRNTPNGTVLGQLLPGVIASVVQNSQNGTTVGGYTWWNIETSSLTGWAAEEYLVDSACVPVPVSDTTPPATPTLNTSVSGTTVNLNWNAVTDPSSVAYEVQKDGVNLITNLTTTSYVATNLSAGNHVFRIRAKDGSNNYSGWSSKTVTISAPGPIVNTGPIVKGGMVTTQGSGSMQLYGDAGANPIDTIVSGISGIVTHDCLENGATYCRVVFDNGQDGWLDDSYLVHTGSSPVPTGPTTVASQFSSGQCVQVTASSLNVRSAPGTSASFLGSQTLNSKGTVLANSNTNPSSANGFIWRQIDFLQGVDGYVAEQYLDPATNCSMPAPAPVPVVDVTAPPVPSFSSSSPNTNAITLSWSSVESGAVYEIRRGTTIVASSLTNLSHTVSGLASGTSYTFQIRAKDAAGNTSAWSASLTVDTLSVVTNPAPPTSNGGTVGVPVTQCSDGVDNDSDGLVDYPNDPGCASPNDDNEDNVAVPPTGNVINVSSGGSIANAIASVTSTPVTIYLAPGTYNVGSGITLPDGVSLVGSGVDKTTITSNITYQSDIYTIQQAGAGAQGVLITTGSNQVIRDLTLDGNNKNISIAIRTAPGSPAPTNVSNVEMYNLHIKEFYTSGVVLTQISNSSLHDTTFYDNSWTSNNNDGYTTASIVWHSTTDVDVYNVDILEREQRSGHIGGGSGMDAIPLPPTYGNTLTRTRFFNSRVFVDPFSPWGGGVNSNIAHEWWGTELIDSEIFNNTYNNNLSLVFEHAGPQGVPSVKVYNNNFFLSDVKSWGVEVTRHDVELYNNYFDTGLVGTPVFANWDGGFRPENTNIHGNLIRIRQGYTNWISSVITFAGGFKNMNFTNNTVHVDTSAEVTMLALYGQGTIVDSHFDNNLFYRSIPKSGGGVDPFLHLEPYGCSTPATFGIQNVTLRNNLFDGINKDAFRTTCNSTKTGDLMQSGNINASAQLNLSGSRYGSYYTPLSTSPAVGGGLDGSNIGAF